MDVLERIENKELNIEVLTLICDGSYCQIDSDELTEELMNHAKLGKQMQWVSVKDGLPEDGQKVDIYVNKYIKRLPDCTYKKERNQFYNSHVGMIKWFDVKKVSHWMPLPPNPKEAE